MQDIETIRRRLTRLMLLSILITLVLLASILATIIYKLNHTNNIYKQTQIVTLPKDAQIISQSLGQNTIALHIKLKENKHFIIIYDYKTAKKLSQLELKTDA